MASVSQKLQYVVSTKAARVLPAPQNAATAAIVLQYYTNNGNRPASIAQLKAAIVASGNCNALFARYYAGMGYLAPAGASNAATPAQVQQYLAAHQPQPTQPAKAAKPAAAKAA